MGCSNLILLPPRRVYDPLCYVAGMWISLTTGFIACAAEFVRRTAVIEEANWQSPD